MHTKVARNIHNSVNVDIHTSKPRRCLFHTHSDIRVPCQGTIMYMCVQNTPHTLCMPFKRTHRNTLLRHHAGCKQRLRVAESRRGNQPTNLEIYKKKTEMIKKEHRRAAVAIAALLGSWALVLVVMSSAGGLGRTTGVVNVSVELLEKEKARICFGSVCAVTSAAFAKVLKSAEQQIYERGEEDGKQKIAQLRQEALRRQGFEQVPLGVLAERDHQDRVRARPAPEWQSEWQKIFGSN
jgi:hypothetical protein